MGNFTDIEALINTTNGKISPSTVVNGLKTVTTAGTQVALGASTTLRQGVWVKALAANTADIYVGNSDVSSATGYVLAAGDSVFVPISNLATVYIDAASNGLGVSFIGA